MKVAIAGGGLVGGLCACILGQRGHQVELYEYRSDPRNEDAKLFKGRSINLALSTRGRATLARAGLEDAILANTIPMKGRMLHSLSGDRKESLYDPNGNQCIYSVSRGYLNETILTEAEKNPNIKLNFGYKLLNADLHKGKLQLRKREGSQENQIEIEADLVIGADGAHSAMRQSMLNRSRTNFSQTYIEHGYMELCIPPTSKGEHAMEKNYLHIWPRNQFMLIALPNQDGSFTATLFMPFEMFGKLTTAEEIRSLFRNEFPDTLDLFGEELLISDVLGSKPSSLISVKCSPLHDGKGVLIGDAAHAMVPFFGQGMNAGFEDVLILDDLLDNWTVEGIEKCLEAFSKERTKDAEAICELAMYNYLEMRSLVNQRGYYFRRLIDLSLNKLLGQGWLPLYNAVTFTRMPYSKCISHRKHQDEIISKINRYCIVGAIACLTTAAAYYWRNLIPI